jgi:hypothetical protein
MTLSTALRLVRPLVLSEMSYFFKKYDISCVRLAYRFDARDFMMGTARAIN